MKGKRTGLDKNLGPHDVEVPIISRELINEGGEVVSPMYRPPLPPEGIPGTHFR